METAEIFTKYINFIKEQGDFENNENIVLYKEDLDSNETNEIIIATGKMVMTQVNFMYLTYILRENNTVCCHELERGGIRYENASYTTR